MSESSKNDLAQKVLFGERVKTLLFLSMGTELPLSILVTKESQPIVQGTVKRGVVKVVSPGSGPVWQRCFTSAFMLDSEEGAWVEIEDVYAISFSDIHDPKVLLRHEMTLNKTQHLGPVYTGATGRNKIDLEVDDGNDSKYYRMLSFYYKEKKL